MPAVEASSNPAALVGDSPLLVVWPERFLFLGRLGHVAKHRHAADVCLVAISGRLGIRVESSPDWWYGTSALIPAGCMHEVQFGNEVTAVLYNDAHRPYYRALSARDRHQPILGIPPEAELQRALRRFRVEETSAGSAARVALERCFAAALGTYADSPPIDARIRKLVKMLESKVDQNFTLEELAEKVNLSPSRLQHLFLGETGVPLRRWRTWMRIRYVLRELARGASVTRAALTCGFASSAHFSHAFKSMFGVSARSALVGKARTRMIFVS
ncbi:MAG: helix-turn-helix transcriptional regulator [Polyangiaceae bacterium]|nr:helix-turn-helix transcriptional regulator [Polyangiaceae bacterium]